MYTLDIYTIWLDFKVEILNLAIFGAKIQSLGKLHVGVRPLRSEANF